MGGERFVYGLVQAIVRRELREGLLAVDGRGKAREFGSVVHRAAAALYALLLEHSVDHRGCCHLCLRPGVLLGRRRPCRIYPVARHWLHEPRTAVLASHLATELGLRVVRPTGGGIDAGPDRAHGHRAGQGGVR